MEGTKYHEIPQWAFEFHGHRCPFMPIGFLAGQYALELLEIDKEMNHQTYAFSEMSQKDSNGCFNDGIQASTGCTYGKGLMTLLGYGKLSMLLYRPGKDAVRVSLSNEFLDALLVKGAEFFQQRKAGKEPSDIPGRVVDQLLSDWLLKLEYKEMFRHEIIQGFHFKPVRQSGVRKKCSECSEYVYEPDLKVSNDKLICKPDYYGIPRNSV